MLDDDDRYQEAYGARKIKRYALAYGGAPKTFAIACIKMQTYY